MKKKILVVDDDSQIRESLRKVLELEGYETILANDGQEALEQFDRENVDLLFLDLNLPLKNGWDVFERFTSLKPLVPIIIITGRPNQSELAAAAGAGALMEKPLDVPILLQTITDLLAEGTEARLKRLVGLPNDLPCLPRSRPVRANRCKLRPPALSYENTKDPRTRKN